MSYTMTRLIDTEQDLEEGLAALAVLDRRFADIRLRAGTPPLRRRPGGFAGLMSIVVSQQLSTASAAAIWARLSAAFEPFEADSVRRARTAKLQRIGLSTPKIRTLKAVAKAVDSGAVDFDALASLSADEAHNALTALHGIGPWTADIYLLACLGHADAWPAGDLALQEASRLAFVLPVRPSTKEMTVLAEPWRPWRGVAARLLWAYYRAVKGREAAPIQPTNASGDKDGGRARRSAA
jgi:DNA-3-methyladenine glycosylase II